MEKEITYKPFKTFVLRTPAIPLKRYQTNLKELINDEFWSNILEDRYIREAIFLASPDLSNDIEKFLRHELKNEKEVNRLKMSVLRYYTRMSSRCTPFGLFAGFSLGKIGKETDLCLKTSENYQRYTRLDMNYLCNLAQNISKLEEIKELLLYYPNSSIYTIADKIRYVEWHYKKTRRIHQISSVDCSDYVNIILSKAKSGASIKELAESIIDEEITFEISKEFVNNLIDEQILVSELDPSITGKDFLIQISNFFEKTNLKNAFLKEQLKVIVSLLSKIDNSAISTSINIYTEIEKCIKELNIPYEKKFLFQTDMYIPVEKSGIDETLIKHVTEHLY